MNETMDKIINYRNSLKDFSAEEFDHEEIIKKYKEFADNNDVFRSLGQESNQIKTFGLRNRAGIHETGDSSRCEETLCQALFNTFRPEENETWKIQNYTQHLIDYQTPLKNTVEDELWGKFDLIGLIQGSPKKKLCFWEVKYGDNADPIHFAIMELLIYYAQFDLTSKKKEESMKNYKNFIVEAAFVRDVGIENNIITIHEDNFPVLFIAADQAYFNRHHWEETKGIYKNFKKMIVEELKLDLVILQISTGHTYDKGNKRFFYDRDREIKTLL